MSLRIYPGGVAGDEPDVVRKMRIGQLHAAALTTAGLADIDPAFQMFNIPMFFDSYPELYAVLDKMEPLLKQRLEAKGFVLLNWGHGGWVHFFTKQPVDNIDALKKTQDVRVGGRRPHGAAAGRRTASSRWRSPRPTS